MHPTSAETPTLELHFKPQTFWQSTSQGWLLGLVVGLIGAGMALQLVIPGWSSERRGVLFLVGGGLGLLLFMLAARLRSKPREAAPVRAYPTHLELPEAAGAPRTQRVEYQDILSLNVAGHGPASILLLGTRDRLLSYAQHSFVEAESIERLSGEIRRQIVRQPGGEQLIARMNLREAIGQAAWAARPVATVALLACLAVGAVITSHANPDSPIPLVDYGANVPLLVREGQWFRLFSANFLHVNLLHLYMNGLGLLTLGALLERLLGPWRFTLIYLISAVGGSLASALAARAPYSVGASTAVFGLLGALAALEWRFRTELPGGFRQTPRWWLIILGVNGALPLLLPMIDGFAHAGGFAAGAIATLIICSHSEAIRRARPAPWNLRIATVLAIGVFALALGTTFAHARADSGRDQLILEQAIVHGGSADPSMLNAVAWQYAVARAPSAAELDLADRAATSATAVEPGELAFLDTLATVQFRRGQLDRAIEIERRVLAARDEDFTFSQVARFLAARQARRGLLAIGTDVAERDISIALSAVDSGGESAPSLELHSGAALPRGAEIWALAMVHGSLAGAVVLRLGPNGGREFRVVPKNGASLAKDELTLHVALIDATSCQSCAPGTLEGEYRRMDPAALALPGGPEASSR